MHTYVVLMYTSETLINHKAYPSCNRAHKDTLANTMHSECLIMAHLNIH